MIQSPNSFFMDVKCPGCLQITTVFSHAQTVVLCGNCNAKRVAVLVPGTQSPGDCVTDLKALPVRVVADGSSVGWVHRGMMRQACAIVRIVGSALERFEKDGYEVLFIGHSLGAGVSAIAGAICRLGIEGVKLKKVRSLCYATPAVGNGSFGKFCEGHAVTVINCEDIVPRLSIETARKLREELSSRREAVRLFVAEDIEALKDINNITEKKTRSKSASLTAAEVQQGEEAAKELAELGIPAPQPGCTIHPWVPHRSSAMVASSPATSASELTSPAAKYERLESNIGEGTYGKATTKLMVHKAFHIKTGQIVAIKKAKESAADRDVGGIGFTALREVKVMNAIRHPNVMTCLDVFVEGGALHLVMEFMDGDLKKVIEDKSVFLTESHCKCLAHQVLQGLQALHERFFVHRDVTPNNVLLSYHDGTAKLSDFGFARSIGERPMTGMCTTLWYRAPELLFGAKFYGQSVDLWSLGCVVAETMLRKPLFPGRGEFDMLQKVIERRGTPSEEVWKDVSALPNFLEFTPHPKETWLPELRAFSEASQRFLDALLTLDPKQRPKAAEVD
ncbi:Cyclin-dependent kinase 7 (CDK-activating kinase) (CAK) (Cell division protein kinase 7) (MO15 homolog) [Durusdinium trenchii]|uniref:Cyclin-dependent kinase 2 homolog n=1 Tax=Durusdinium trenchii TaxID=1381693 RepID=A0ABP0SSR5_9DINO